jgi:FAD/FMN-containing dehydrogenase/Fe-S oxidoreductase
MSRTIHLPTRTAPQARPQGRSGAPEGEAGALAAELGRRLRGEVRFDAGSRALYATDLSIYRQVPIGVVVPRTTEDVIETVAACHRRGVPILGRGGGTSLSGQTCNVAVVVDFSKYLNRILEIDPQAKTAWVEPGVICDQLKHATEPDKLTFPPDPATHEYCTFGGMIGNNSCGVHSVMGGRTSDNVEELDILTYDGQRMRVGPTAPAELDRIIAQGGRHGQIYRDLLALRDRYGVEVRARFPDIPRRVSGYNLDDLLPERGFHVGRALAGSEGTCVLVLAAKLRLIHSPPHRALLVIGYPDPYSAGDQVPELMAHQPTGLEAFHVHVLENMRHKHKAAPGEHLLPRGNTWMLAEFGGETAREAADWAHDVMARVRGHDGRLDMKVFDDPQDQKQIWHIRESGVGASRVPGEEDAWPSWEDAAVPPARVGDYLRDFDKLIDRFGYKYTLFGHFGQGCLHTRITFRLKTPEGVREFRAFMEAAADLVIAYGGSLSGEHGDGQAKGELLPRMFGPRLVEAFKEFKRIWDPDWKMNPGKVVDANPLDSNIRVGPDHHPRPVLTYFKYADDAHSFANATERCFGVGKCRRLEGGQGDNATMCPSFMVTREEMHSTRGRAHLLFEMLRGEVLEDGWRSEPVKESLDLCLACKGCKGDCPVKVDIATYKAEFLAHYYQHKARPRIAYALGLIDLWARLASAAPGVANFFTQSPIISDWVKSLAGITTERHLPAFAPQTFRAWFAARPPRNVEKAPVMLWPDTFNNYFHPRTAQAAVEVLEAAGRRVILPDAVLCCGRPLYDYGMLDRAQRLARQSLDALRPALRAGIPLVGLEPSCVAVFRDEMVNLFPNDPDVRALSEQTFTLGEFLARRTHFRPPKLRRKAVLHGHCHHKAIMGLDGEQQLLEQMGLDFQTLQSTCCGVAGSFGYEKEKYDISMQIGEHDLLPQIRAASKEALVIADGFSCRSQIEHATDRRALHIAEVVKMAIEKGGRESSGTYPERDFSEPRPWAPSRQAVAAGLVAAGLAGGAGLAWWLTQRRRRRAARMTFGA